jgi:hypothetical protein
MLAYKFRSSKPFARTLDIICEGRLHCADWTKFNDPREGFFEYSLADKQKAQAIRSAKRQYRICCLSKSVGSRLLWAHYASGFDGLAIEVELPDDRNNGPIYDVNYEWSLPNADAQFGDPDTLALSFLRRKDKEWCYENEVRIIQGNVWYQFNSPVRRIIVGHRFNRSLLKKLRLVCQERNIELQRTSIQNQAVIAVAI